MFSEFDSYLKLEFLVDYWCDEGSGIASSMLSKFDEQDWMELKEQCLPRDEGWRIKCAEVLDLASHPISTEILLELLASREDDVVIAAADSLRSKSGVQLTANSVERLANLAQQGSAPVKAVLGNLLSQLGAA